MQNWEFKEIYSFYKSIHSPQIQTRFDVNMTSSIWWKCAGWRYKLHCDVTDEKQSNVRQQFVSYMIRNMAGCCVSFATQTSLSGLHSNHELTGWFEFLCYCNSFISETSGFAAICCYILVTKFICFIKIFFNFWNIF